MNLASILNLISVLVTFFPEIQALFNRVWEEIDRGLAPGEVSGLNVMGKTAQFSPEFIKELQTKHDEAIIALEQAFDPNGEVLQATVMFGTGGFLKLIPELIRYREQITAVIELVGLFTSGQITLSDVIEAVKKLASEKVSEPVQDSSIPSTK